MSRFGKRLKFAAKLVLSLGIIYILFSQLDGEQASEIVARANPFLLFLPFLVMVIDRVWMAWKWRMLLAIMAPAPSLYEAVRVYYISSFQGIALPLGGLGPDLVRYAHLRSSRVGSHAVAVSIVMERILGLLATIIVSLVSCALLVQAFEFSSKVSRIIQWVLAAGGGGAVFLTALLFSRTLQRAIYRRLANIAFLSDRPAFERVVTALKQNSDAPGVLFVNLVLSVIEQLFPVIAYTLGAVAFEVPLSFVDCLAAVPISTLLQRLPISYAGLGIREGALVFLFGLLGINYSDALILSTAMFLVFVCSVLLGGLWSFVHGGFESEEGSVQHQASI